MVKSVLLIDDDPLCLVHCRRLLAACNSNLVIHTAKNGFDALQHVYRAIEGHAQMPDYILLDLEMPVMAGKEFLETYRSLLFFEKQQIKLLVMSDKLRTISKHELGFYGANKFSGKPLTLECLRSFLEDSQTV